MFAEKVKEKIVIVYFMALACIMYYCLDGWLELRVYVTYRHALALLIIVSACVCFLVKPNVARMVTAFKSCMAFSAPTFVFLVVSLFIWCYNRETPSVIARGLSSNFFFISHFASVFAAGAFLYMFGEKGIWYNLICILGVNLFMLGKLMLEQGIGAYFSDLVTLILTFAGETGDAIAGAEIHELAFCLSAYLVYMLIYFEKRSGFLMMLFLALFCFLSAFKRIAVAAVLVSAVLGIFLKFWVKLGQKKTVSKILGILMAVVCLVLLAYIGLVYAGLFDWMEKAGIDTMSRAPAYEWAANYYEFSPTFIGRGIGFLTYQLQNDGNLLGLNTIHNDFLQYFVDLGFWGYIIWLLSMTAFRVKYFEKASGINAGINAAAIVLSTVIVSSTDNTLRYPLYITVMALLTMGYGFDKRAEATGKRIFGDSYEEDPGRHSLQ